MAENNRVFEFSEEDYESIAFPINDSFPLKISQIERKKSARKKFGLKNVIKSYQNIIFPFIF